MNDSEDFVEVSTSNQNSIEINVNAKGEASWKAKVYHDDPDVMKTLIEKYSTMAKEEAAKNG